MKNCRLTRRELVMAWGAAALAPAHTFAQQPSAKTVCIGVLGAASASGYRAHAEALREGLRDAGYIEGKNLTLDFRWAEGKTERLEELAGDLVRLKPDVLITHSPIVTKAVRNATAVIPIVTYMGDFVKPGFAASLARPGGNVTGISFLGLEVAAKRLELLLETVPQVKRVAVLVNFSTLTSRAIYTAVEAVAASRKVAISAYEAKNVAQIQAAFDAMSKNKAGAVTVFDDPVFVNHSKTIIEEAARRRLPLSGPSGFAEAGALTSSGVNLVELWRRMAYFADRILKGASPATFPIEQPTTFEFTVNLKTAKALGIKLPGSILIRATKVIE